MSPVLRFLAALALAAAPLAHAEPYPSKPIHFVIPYPAGGPLDTVARMLGQKVSASLKQSVIVENKPGAGGNIGADAVKDFAPITQVASTPNVLVVNPSVPVSDVKGFIAYAKAHPGELNFGSGSTGHLAGELFKTMAGVQMVHVPYKGAGPAMQDLIGGRIQLMFDNLASALGQIRAGRVRALAITTAKRSSLAPELPTIAESGLLGFDISTWFGVFAPAGTPPAVVARLHDEFVKALAAPEVREKMVHMGAEPVGSTPEEFAAYIRSESRKYAAIIKASGAKVD